MGTFLENFKDQTNQKLKKTNIDRKNPQHSKKLHFRGHIFAVQYVYPFPCNHPSSYLCMLCSRNSPVHHYTKNPVRSSMAMWWKLCFLYLCFVGDIIPSYYWLSLILLLHLLNTTENRTNVNDIKSTLVATGEGWQFNNARWQVGKLVASTSFASCFVFLGSSTAPISVRSSYTHVVSGCVVDCYFHLVLYDDAKSMLKFFCHLIWW